MLFLGLGFRPLPKHVESGSLIKYNAANSSEVDQWVKIIDEFLESKVMIYITYNKNLTNLLNNFY